MKKYLAAILCATFLTASAHQTNEDWYVSTIDEDVVTMYRNVKAVGPARFHVEMQSVFKPLDTMLTETTFIYKLHGTMSVNCLTRTTKVISDVTYDNRGVHIKALDNKFSKKDRDAYPQPGSAQHVILTSVCGEQDIEWSDT